MLTAQRTAAAESTLAMRPAHSGLSNLQTVAREVEDAWLVYQSQMVGVCRGWFANTLRRLDCRLRTKEVEFLDRLDISEDERTVALIGLDQINEKVGSYQHALSVLRPVLAQAAKQRAGLPVRVLEVASGHAGLMLHLAKVAKREGLDLELTGSDLQPHLMDVATMAADVAKAKVTFEVHDATNLSEVPESRYDVVVAMQALHHFPPGQAGCLLREAFRVSTSAVVVLDIPRAAHRVPKFLLGVLVLSRNTKLARDARVSAGKAYDTPELDLIARVAVPEAQIEHTRVAADLQALTLRHA